MIRVERSYDVDEGVFVDPKSDSGIRRVRIAGVLRDRLLAWKLEAGTGELVFPREDGTPFDPSAARARALRAWTAVDDASCAGTTKAGERWRRLARRGYATCGRHRDQEPPDGAARPRSVEPIGFHEARHTFASLMIAAGVNVKALSTFMGHASVAITLDRYGHLLPGGEEEAAARLDAFLERANTQARLAQVDGDAPVARQSDTDPSGRERITADDTEGAD